MNLRLSTSAILAAALTAAGLAAAPAHAEQWYGGIQVERVQGSLDTGRVNNDLTQGLGFFTASTTADKTDTGGRVYLGGLLHPNFGVEVHLADYGRLQWRSEVSPPGTLSARIRTRGASVAAVGRYAFTPELAAYGRLGVAKTQSDVRYDASGFVELLKTEAKVRTTTAVIAAGVEYTFAGRYFARFDVEHLPKVGGTDTGGKFKQTSVGLGVGMKF